MKKKQEAITSVNQILLGDNLGELADQLYSAGYEPVKLILIGVDDSGMPVLVSSNSISLGELIGILHLAIERIGRE